MNFMSIVGLVDQVIFNTNKNSIIQLQVDNAYYQGKLNEPEKKQTERIQALEEKTDTLAKAICALLRVEINTIFIKVNEEGEINSTDLELVTKLYESYKSLGGNGIIAKEMAVIDTLHVVSQ